MLRGLWVVFGCVWATNAVFCAQGSLPDPFYVGKIDVKTNRRPGVQRFLIQLIQRQQGSTPILGPNLVETPILNNPAMGWFTKFPDEQAAIDYFIRHEPNIRYPPEIESNLPAPVSVPVIPVPVSVPVPAPVAPVPVPVPVAVPAPAPPALQNLQASVRDLQAEVDRVNAANQVLRDQLAAPQAGNANVGQLQANLAAAQAASGTAADLQAKVDRLTGELAAAQAASGTAVDLQAKVDRLTGELAAAQAAGGKLQAEVTRLINELASRPTQADVNKAMASGGNAAQLQPDVTRLTNELVVARAAAANVTQLQTDLATEKAKVNQLTADLTAAQAALAAGGGGGGGGGAGAGAAGGAGGVNYLPMLQRCEQRLTRLQKVVTYVKTLKNEDVRYAEVDEILLMLD